MIHALLGFKVDQAQQFDPDGRRIPVTTIEAGPCWVTQKTERSVQLGFGTIKNMSKAETGHIKKAGLDKKLRFLRSFPVSDVTMGQEIKVGDVFAVGDSIRVTGTSKGKGFAGVVKRHGFAGGPRTHGQSDRERSPGSIGQTTTPGRVYVGKRMAGHLGDEQKTVQRLKIVRIDAERQLLLIRGAVPGARNGDVTVYPAVKGGKAAVQLAAAKAGA